MRRRGVHAGAIAFADIEEFTRTEAERARHQHRRELLAAGVVLADRIVEEASRGGELLGARIDAETKRRLAIQMKRNRVGLYWIYLRSVNSPSLFGSASDASNQNETSPEIALDEFFKSLGSPYRAYEAQNSGAILQAAQDVNRLENRPMIFKELVPRRDLSWECYLLAAVMLTILLTSKFMEIKSWR